MEAITSLERQHARAIAEEYRSRGYEVIEEPSPEQLPDFLSGYRPDLLIRNRICSSEKGDEAIVVKEEGIVLDRISPLYILKQAVINGVISRDDYNFLMNVMKYRNALVHGFKTIDLDPALVKRLISTTRRLLQPTSAS